jgi:phosphatidylserine/phosphatidylglycerophosphate/cardiolipin synthase-like enzyme
MSKAVADCSHYQQITAEQILEQSNKVPSGASAIQTMPWFVSTGTHYPMREPNQVEPQLTGAAVFSTMHQLINQAQSSIDILSWGIETHLPLIRNAGDTAEDHQKNELASVLEAAAKRGVRVRILIWEMSLFEPNVMDPRDLWYRARIGEEEIKNLQFAFRRYDGKPPPEWGVPSCTQLQGHGDGLGTQAVATRKVLYGLSYTHHQKMFLCDIGLPEFAAGLVMGHNLKHAYWDDSEHKTFSTLRLPPEGRKNLPITPPAGIASKPWLWLQPWRDVSCLLRGPVLVDLHSNFEQAWSELAGNEAHPPTLLRQRISNAPLSHPLETLNLSGLQNHMAKIAPLV